MIRAAASVVDVLILGAGWTSTFLLPLLESQSVSHAATTRDGRSNTIPFVFDPSATSPEPYRTLPKAKTVLITFPLVGKGQSKQLTSLYRSVHGNENNWIQLGSTGAFTAQHWNDADSPVDLSNERVIAEEELRTEADGVILHLAGLYGGPRDPKTWVPRVAKSKEDVRKKTTVHLIHGADVAAGILASHRHFTPRKRWLLTDLHVYDWWDLFVSWGPKLKVDGIDGPQYVQWVGELMVENDVRALPREIEGLGRILDSRSFWKTVGVWPQQGRAN